MADYDENIMAENDIGGSSEPSIDTSVKQRWGRPDVGNFDPMKEGKVGAQGGGSSGLG